jgi:hypothetical protein
VGELVRAVAELGVVFGVAGDVDVLFEHPHGDVFFKEIRMGGGIFGDNLADRRAPGLLDRE